jgi:hypothetical protein
MPLLENAVLSGISVAENIANVIRPWEEDIPELFIVKIVKIAFLSSPVLLFSLFK